MVVFVSCQASSEKNEDKALIQDVLTHSAFVKGKFRQERHLEGVVRSIKSSGEFAVWRDNGIYWETNEPLFQATSFLRECVYYWTGKNSFSRVKDGVFQINERIYQIMLAFFTADFEGLSADFEAEWQGNADSWLVKLSPSNVYVKKAINQVTIKGGQHIDSVDLIMSTGDRTSVWLSVLAENDMPDPVSKHKIYPEYNSDRCR